MGKKEIPRYVQNGASVQTLSWSHWIIEFFGLEGTFLGHLVQLSIPHHGHSHLSIYEVAQSLVQPDSSRDQATTASLGGLFQHLTPFVFKKLIHGSTHPWVYIFLKREGLHPFCFHFLSVDSKNLLWVNVWSYGGLTEALCLLTLILSVGEESHVCAKGHPNSCCSSISTEGSTCDLAFVFIAGATLATYLENVLNFFQLYQLLYWKSIPVSENLALFAF